MTGRAKSCGPCGMCCKVFAVKELAKPAGVMCAHYGGGCGIYAARPESCRSFECVWLMDPEMPHRFRPDQTKVVLDQDAKGDRLIARCDPANPLAWRRDPMHAALRGRAILVRRFNAPRIADHLRITVGTDGQTEALLSALAEILAA